MRMSDLRPPLAALALLLATAVAARGQDGEVEGGDGPTMVVGVKEAAPFTIKGPDGSWRGLSINLWREVADELGYRYEFRERPLKGLFDGLQDGSLDAAVAALTITPAREAEIDFTHPFYNSGLGLAVSAAPRRTWLGTVWGLVASAEFLQVVGGLLATLLAVGLIAWLLERRANPEQFGGRGLHGLFQGFWWSAVTMTTVGYGDKAPRTVPGRLLATFWMFASLIAVSAFTATIASMLTLARLESPIQGPEDLPGARVADSTSAEYLRDHRIGFAPFATPREALQAVADDRADVAVYDMPMLRYLIKHEMDDALTVLPRRFDRQNYGLALPEASPLREPINRALLRRVSEPEWDDELFLYLGRL